MQISFQDKWDKLHCKPRFTKFFTDFEPAEMNAVAHVFGNDKVS